MKTRFDKLWNYIEENLEVDYGYLPMFDMYNKDDTHVDEYIKMIKGDIEAMLENGWIIEEGKQECIEILKGLDKI